MVVAFRSLSSFSGCLQRVQLRERLRQVLADTSLIAEEASWGRREKTAAIVENVLLVAEVPSVAKRFGGDTLEPEVLDEADGLIMFTETVQDGKEFGLFLGSLGLIAIQPRGKQPVGVCVA